MWPQRRKKGCLVFVSDMKQPLCDRLSLFSNESITTFAVLSLTSVYLCVCGLLFRPRPISYLPQEHNLSITVRLTKSRTVAPAHSLLFFTQGFCPFLLWRSTILHPLHLSHLIAPPFSIHPTPPSSPRSNQPSCSAEFV